MTMWKYVLQIVLRCLPLEQIVAQVVGMFLARVGKGRAVVTAERAAELVRRLAEIVTVLEAAMEDGTVDAAEAAEVSAKTRLAIETLKAWAAGEPTPPEARENWKAGD